LAGRASLSNGRRAAHRLPKPHKGVGDNGLLEFSMSPLGKGECRSTCPVLDIIDKSGVDYRLNPMGTVLEGEWDEVFGVVKKCYERMRKDCGRISCTIKVDYRKAAKGRLSGKVASVEKRLKRAIKQ
jgi:uncharacterized protein (TIGR00106 family)